MNLQKIWCKLLECFYLPTFHQKDIDKGFDIRTAIEDKRVKFYAKANGKNKFYPEKPEVCVLSKSLESCAKAEKFDISTGEVITTYGGRCTRRMNLYVRITLEDGGVNMATQRIARNSYTLKEASNTVA